MGIQESFFFGGDGGSRDTPFPPDYFQNLRANGIYCGTSSWKFRGWEKIFYGRKYASEADFQRASLREYAELLPTVSVDSTYYAWPQSSQLALLFDSVPEHFRFCFKVTDTIVMNHLPALARYGRNAGKANPFFLDADAFLEHFWKPLEKFRGRLGLINFEFPALLENDLERLEKFFSVIPEEIHCAVELRTPSLVRAEVYRSLREWKVSPCWNSWTGMPALSEQLSLWKRVEAQENVEIGAKQKLPLMVRALVPAQYTYAESVAALEPYDQRRRPYPAVFPELAEIIGLAKSEKREAYIILGNLLEGSAPFSLGELARTLR